jgi:hypothetical protein
MAVATIKDLLNPLTKIQAATESSAESLAALTVTINSLAAKKPAVSTDGGASLTKDAILMLSTGIDNIADALSKAASAQSTENKNILEELSGSTFWTIAKFTWARKIQIKNWTEDKKNTKAITGALDDLDVRNQEGGPLAGKSKQDKAGAEVLELLGVGAGVVDGVGVKPKHTTGTRHRSKIIRGIRFIMNKCSILITPRTCSNYGNVDLSCGVGFDREIITLSSTS